MAQFAPPPTQFQSAGAGSFAQPFQPMQPGSAGGAAAAGAQPPGTNLFQKPKPAADEPPLAAGAQAGDPAAPSQAAAAAEGQPVLDAPAADAPLEEAGWDEYEAPGQDSEMYGAMESDANADMAAAASEHYDSYEQPVDYSDQPADYSEQPVDYSEQYAQEDWDGGSGHEVGRPTPNRQLVFEQCSRRGDADAEAGPVDSPAAAWPADTSASGQAASSARQRLQGLEATIAALERSQQEASPLCSARVRECREQHACAPCFASPCRMGAWSKPGSHQVSSEKEPAVASSQCSK